LIFVEYSKLKMNYIDRQKLTILGRSVRLYTHNAGFPKVWSNGVGRIYTASKIYDYVNSSFEKNGSEFKKFDYMIGIAWGNKESSSRMIDVFGYELNKKVWPGNPDVTILNIKDGVLVKNRPISTCGDGLIMLGEEEKHRRESVNLESYLNSFPKFNISG